MMFGRMDGKKVVRIMVSGNNVRFKSMVKSIRALNGKELELRVKLDSRGIAADGRKMVKPGEPGYVEAAIDTLEIMGIDVVG